jgi:type II secretory pathway pseudopilin PulG
MKTRLQNSTSRSLKAFTLAEVVMSILIVNIAATGLMGCFKYAYFVTALARENQRATQVMLERTEAIRLCSWDQVRSNGFIPTTFTDYFDPTAASGSRGTTYNGTVSVTSFPFSTSYRDNMRQLTLTVTWQTGSVIRARTNVTYIAKDGIQNYVY